MGTTKKSPNIKNTDKNVKDQKKIQEKKSEESKNRSIDDGNKPVKESHTDDKKAFTQDATKSIGDSKKLSKKQKKVIGISVVAAACAACAVYVGPSVYYNNHFFPNTTIGSVDVSKRTALVADRVLNERVTGYSLTMLQRGDAKFNIPSDVINASIDEENIAKTILDKQNGFKWPKEIKRDHKNDLSVSYDKAAVEKRIDDEITAHKASFEEPVNATIYYDAENEKFAAKEGSEGTTIDPKETIKACDDAITSLKEEVDMDKEGCYERPEFIVGEEPFDTQLALANTMNEALITYEGDGINKHELTKEDIHGFIDIDNENCQVTLDESKLAAFVSDLSNDYLTSGTSREFTTHEEKTVYLSGPYGWMVDEEREVSYLNDAIKQGKKESHEPVWKQKGAAHDPDWGTEYIEVDLTAQKLFYIKEGEASLTADIISGDVKTSNETETGLYEVIKYEVIKTDDKNVITFTLSGDDAIRSDESRSDFGADTYKENGTDDGSIALSKADAEALKKAIKKSCPVIIYATNTGSTGAAQTADTSQSGENTDSSYQNVLDDYTKTLWEKSADLTAEYKNDARYVTGTKELAKLCNKKLDVLAGVCDEGITEMAKLHYAFNDSRSTYEDWANKLIKVYNEAAKDITDAYVSAGGKKDDIDPNNAIGTNTKAETETEVKDNNPKKTVEEKTEEIPGDYRHEVADDLPDGYFD